MTYEEEKARLRDLTDVELLDVISDLAVAFRGAVVGGDIEWVDLRVHTDGSRISIRLRDALAEREQRRLAKPPA